MTLEGKQQSTEEDKQPLLSETEQVTSFIPPHQTQQQKQQQPTAAVVSTDQATAELRTENTDCKVFFEISKMSSI